jgi:hypothetical protein
MKYLHTMVRPLNFASRGCQCRILAPGDLTKEWALAFSIYLPWAVVLTNGSESALEKPRTRRGFSWLNLEPGLSG